MSSTGEHIGIVGGSGLYDLDGSADVVGHAVDPTLRQTAHGRLRATGALRACRPLGDQLVLLDTADGHAMAAATRAPRIMRGLPRW